MEKFVCPWWLAYTFDHPFRHIFHKPETIFSPYLHEGMTAIDIGCGMGYFSIGMARVVGDHGKVIAVDLQQKMLDTLIKRAEAAGLSHRIQTILCEENHLNFNKQVDFALTFWMAHETPDAFNFLKQVHAILKPLGKLLLAEPKIHITSTEFNNAVSIAQELGFKLIDSPNITFSRTAVFEKAVATRERHQ